MDERKWASCWVADSRSAWLGERLADKRADTSMSIQKGKRRGRRKKGEKRRERKEGESRANQLDAVK